MEDVAAITEIDQVGGHRGAGDYRAARVEAPQLVPVGDTESVEPPVGTAHVERVAHHRGARADRTSGFEAPAQTGETVHHSFLSVHAGVLGASPEHCLGVLHHGSLAAPQREPRKERHEHADSDPTPALNLNH